MSDSWLNRTMRWVNELDAIPTALVAKLMRAYEDEVEEVTVPHIYSDVEICGGEHDGEAGYIKKRIRDIDGNVDNYIVETNMGDQIRVTGADFDLIDQNDVLPMWGYMWSPHHSADAEWILQHLDIVCDCGFRVYIQEDLEVLLGIDGCGYDFFEAHWVPLYKAYHNSIYEGE